MKLEFIITDNNITIKDYLIKIDFSHRLTRLIKKSGRFCVNDIEVKNHYLLKSGDRLVLEWEEVINEDIIPSYEQLDIIYEDEFLLIVNKPSNLVCHPTRKHFLDSLSNIIRGYYLKNEIKANIHLVNRLDAATSGLIIVAKSGYIHYLMSQDFNNIARYYFAKVDGIVQKDSGVIDLPIKRISESSILREVNPEGKTSLTEFSVIRRLNNSTILKIQLITGRTHQIRVHTKAIGHPIVGDKLYNKAEGTMYLTCYRLSFNHPITNKRMNVESYPHWLKEELNA